MKKPVKTVFFQLFCCAFETRCKRMQMFSAFQATFSSCFGAPFLVWHPIVYAEMLAQKLEEHKSSAYLLNTGELALNRWCRVGAFLGTGNLWD